MPRVGSASTVIAVHKPGTERLAEHGWSYMVPTNVFG
jgi:hypothetical protein